MIGPFRGRSVRELITRVRQQVGIRLDRVGIGGGVRLPEDGPFLGRLGYPGPEELLGGFRSGPAEKVFPALREPERVAGLLKDRWPHRVQEILARAQNLHESRFDLLGLRGLSFGDPVDWHLDPVLACRSPLIHWSRLDFLDAAQVGDHKVIWELNRHQYFLVLCRAWLLTGERRHAELVVEHLNAWMDANPPNMGVNWASSLELAYRSVAWLWTLSFLAKGRALPAPTLLRALKFLWVQGRHIEAHLSTYFSPNTHLTGEALGLLYLGSLIPELPDSPRWRGLGWRILVSQLESQVEKDGTYFERASYYHRYTVDIYTHALLLGRAVGSPETELALVQGNLHLLLDHLAFFTRPDGTTPLFGDDDGGHLWFPDPERPTDFRPTLANGAALLERADLAYVCGGAREETLWLLGEEGVRTLDGLETRAPARTSRGFPEGGFFVLRDGWSDSANQMVVDAGPHGVLNCGHAHADALSFDLTVGGLPVLVDPGTFTYVDACVRNAFRSARWHNTVTVDGQGPSVPGGMFQWEHVVDVEVSAWRAGDRFDVLRAGHRGFSRIGKPGTHDRDVVFARGRGWLIRDGIDLPPGHRTELNFQVAPGLILEEAEGGSVIRGEDGSALLHLFFFSADGRGGAIVGEVSQGWVSDVYARRHSAPRWRVSVDTSVGEVFTLLIPGATHRPTIAMKEEESGLCLHFRSKGESHRVWMGNGESHQTPDWETDAHLVWAYRERAEGKGGAVALSASRLRLDACWILDGNHRVEVQEASLGGGIWRALSSERRPGADSNSEAQT